MTILACDKGHGTFVSERQIDRAFAQCTSIIPPFHLRSIVLRRLLYWPFILFVTYPRWSCDRSGHRRCPWKVV